jgi:hypothetical protein
MFFNALPALILTCYSFSTPKITTMTTVIKSLKAVGKYVNTAHVDDVIRNYKKERWAPASERLGKPDSLSCWYTVAELEDFLATVKSHGGNGIRIYFGAYAHDFAAKPEYAGRQTIVLVGTKRTETTRTSADKDIYIYDGTKTNILAYNVSRMCPPICNADEWGGLGIAIIEQKDKGLSVI